MAKKIREFMTHREPSEHIWMERDESAVIGTALMGKRTVPHIRPFDLGRYGTRRQTNVLYPARRGALHHRQPEIPAHGALQPQAGASQGVQ